jgi:hypothetical protein
MSGPSQPPPSDPSPREPYRLAPIPCRHRQRSRELIWRTALAAVPSRVAVFGAGACEEIPLAELVARFAEVTLNDVEEQPLRDAVEALGLSTEARDKLRVEVSDLSGFAQPALTGIDQALATASDASSAIDAMTSVLETVEPTPFPITGRFEFVVASCVLSQLHYGLTHQAAERLASRFPGAVEALRQSTAWKSALYAVARRMEDRFIAEMAALLVDGGLAYLSESAQMCYLRLAPDGQWQSEGTYRMLRSKDLAEYVRGRFGIVGRERWEWIVSPPASAGDVGRMYDVQALVLLPLGR